MERSNIICAAILALSVFTKVLAADIALPKAFHPIMQQPKYSQALWGLYVKDLQTDEVLLSQNADKLFSPASTTKLFSVAALLHTFGEHYRFQTPLYARGSIEEGTLNGDLILVGQGDLTFGGRESDSDLISFTKLDHIIANEVPGVILTPEDPLRAIDELARQVYQSGIRTIKGNILIDDRLFETTEKRGLVLSPIMINENLIDFVINPTAIGQKASFTWRPQIPHYQIDNQVQTVAGKGPLAIAIETDTSGKQLIIKGTIPEDARNVVRTVPIRNPAAFARAALIEALAQHGIQMPAMTPPPSSLPTSYDNLKQIGVWTSPPLAEYAKLILKVSHNLGADLIPLLLAADQGKKTFDDGMQLFGTIVTDIFKLPFNTFVFVDAAGGNDNRLTPEAEVRLLEYMHKKPLFQFQRYYDALPILGVDGSLEDFAKTTEAAGKIRAKPGTGVILNLATGKFFLTTQALAGYIEGKNGHLFAYSLIVNNAAMPTIDDIFAIFEDEAELSSQIYNQTTQ